MTLDRNQNVLNAVDTIRKVGTEIDALISELSISITDNLISIYPAAEVEFETYTDHPSEDYYSPTGWVSEGWRWTFPAKIRKAGRGKRSKAGKLSIAVDLGREDNLASQLAFPTLLVAWAGLDSDWSGELDVEEGVFWPVEKSSYELRDGRLLWWVGTKTEKNNDPADNSAAKAMEASWLFLVPLFEIGNRSDIERLIIRPVLDLLKDKPPAEAFSKAPEVVRLQWEHGKSAAHARKKAGKPNTRRI